LETFSQSWISDAALKRNSEMWKEMYRSPDTMDIQDNVSATLAIE
jgi:hypothetical protein